MGTNTMRGSTTVEIMFDTANLQDIERLMPIYPLAGVTTNPSILKKEGKLDFYAHFRRIREIIGTDRTLHVQVIRPDLQGILDDAHRLLDNIDEHVYPKIPLTEAGLAAMRILKEEGVKVTGTALYSKAQGFLAIASGVDYIAPYYNRMQSIDIDTVSVINSLAQFIRRTDSTTKVLAASFKNVRQVTHAMESGAHAITVTPKLLRQALGTPTITSAVDVFLDDWREIYGTDHLPER